MQSVLKESLVLRQIYRMLELSASLQLLRLRLAQIFSECACALDQR